MSVEDVVLFVIVPGLIAALIMAFMLGYGRRLGRGSKSLGWIVALVIIAAPLLLFVFAQNYGSMPDRVEAPIESSVPDEAVEPRKKRPITRRSTRRRNSDGSIETRTVTTGGDDSGSEPTASEVEREALTTSATPDRVSNEEYDTVDILFGTDRDADTSGPRVKFGANRAGKLTLGQSTVTIPKNHTPGIVERPWEISVVGITLYKQDEDPAKHFTIQEASILDEDAFVAAANGRLAASQSYRNQAAIFIHGYNNDFDTALFRTAQMVYDMGFDGAPFLYSWPSAAGYSTYEYDQQSVRQSIDHLKKFIKIVTQDTRADKVHLVAHSMGNEVLLGALRELRFEFGGDREYNISQVILAAPDVDRNVFERLARQIAGISKGVTLYASSNDKALQFSRTLAGGIARAGDVPEQGPVVVNGVDTIDVSATQQDFWGANHNTYAETSELLQDIKQIFRTGVRPPSVRTPSLQKVPLPAGAYWRFPSKP